MSGKHLRASQRTSLTRTSTSRCAAYCFCAHMLRQRDALPHIVWHTLTLDAFLQEDEGDDEEKDGEPREHRQAVPCNAPCVTSRRLLHVHRGTHSTQARDIWNLQSAQTETAGAARRQEEGTARGSWSRGLTARRALRPADQALRTGSISSRGVQINPLTYEAARRIVL